jgi:hypothetical protein
MSGSSKLHLLSLGEKRLGILDLKLPLIARLSLFLQLESQLLPLRFLKTQLTESKAPIMCKSPLYLLGIQRLGKLKS